MSCILSDALPGAEQNFHPQLLLHGFLQSQQVALSQPAVQEGKDADKRILADKAFLNALVVKDPKRLIEHLLVKGALLQRKGMSLVDGFFRGVAIFQRCGPQVMKFRPHILKIDVVVAPQYFHTVHTNGCPALMVGAFAVTGGKILNVTPERRAQVIILQFVPDSTPSGYACHVTTSQSR